ncbi:MAG: hypothetical protein ACOC8H_02145 [bacterium]
MRGNVRVLPLISIGLALGLTTSAWLGLPAAAEPDPEPLRSYQRKCRLVRRLEERLAGSPEGQAAPKGQQNDLGSKLLQIFEQGVATEGLGESFWRYYRAKLLLLSGDRKKAAAILTDLASSPGLAPEALVALCWDIEPLDTFFLPDAETVGDESLYVPLLGRLLPASRFAPWGETRRETAVMKGQALLCIARGFEAMHMHRQAANAYRELVYSAGKPPEGSAPLHHGWLGTGAARYWQKVAELELRDGNRQAAANHLAKAIVYGDRQQARTGLEWATHLTGDFRLLSAKPKPDAARLEQIARRYAEIRLYPRALAILDEYRGLLGQAVVRRLRARWLRAWLGEPVPLPDPRLPTRIPFPCDKKRLAEAAQKARDRLPKLLKELRKNDED